MLFTVKNLFSEDNEKNYSTTEFNKKLKVKDKPKVSIDSIPKLNVSSKQKLPENTARIFDFTKFDIQKNKNSNSTSQATAKNAPNNIERKIDAELKKLELLGIICFNEKRIATIKIKATTKRPSKVTMPKKPKEKAVDKEQNLPSNPTKTYEENDVLDLGFKVIKINKNNVILAKNGYKKTLMMKGDSN